MNIILHGRWMACGAMALLLAGCGGDGLSRTFGLSRTAPDEFTVTTRAPLSMPPDFSLRPPEPGAERPQEASGARSAEAALSPQTVLMQPAAGASSPGQEALVQAAGRAPSDIRSRIDSDAARESDDQALADRLLFWRTPKPPGDVVDAQQEAARLKKDAALGADGGDAPVIRRRNRGLIDDIF